MRRWWVWAAATLLTACAGPATGPAAPAPPEPTPIQRLAAFLPALADYAAADYDAWVVEQHTGSEHARLDYPRIGDTDRVEPPGCASPPYAATSDLTADVIGRETNLGPTGFGPEVSIRLVRHPAGDPVAAARDWARGCHDVLVVDDTSGYRQPVAASVLPSVDVDGTEMLRILRVDNRVQRYQPEGRREHLVTVAVVGDVAVYGYSHDDLALSERLMALTIRRLRDGRPAAAPTADPPPPATSSLAGAGAVRLARLLPTTADLGPDWLVAQRLPMFDTREEYYRSDPAVTPAGCDVPALLTTINLPPHAGGDRPLRLVAGAAAARPDAERPVNLSLESDYDTHDRVRLAIESDGADVVAATRAWADRCAHWTGKDGSGAVEVLPVSAPAGADDAVSVHLTPAGGHQPDFTASALRIRGLLLITLPALDRHAGPLLSTTLANIRAAAFTDPPPPPRPPRPDYHATPPGRLTLPAPSEAATERLSRVFAGTRVDPAPYHRAGYLPGEAPVEYPDRLYFRSPTGSINCVFYQHYGDLTCDVPAGSYPRAPAPPPDGTWIDTAVHFGYDGIDSGVRSYLPPAAAEAKVLPYGATLALSSDAGPVLMNCLMARDGLTCVSTRTRVGLALSREALTPLVATAALPTS